MNKFFMRRYVKNRHNEEVLLACDYKICSYYFLNAASLAQRPNHLIFPYPICRWIWESKSDTAVACRWIYWGDSKSDTDDRFWTGFIVQNLSSVSPSWGVVRMSGDYIDHSNKQFQQQWKGMWWHQRNSYNQGEKRLIITMMDTTVIIMWSLQLQDYQNKNREETRHTCFSMHMILNAHVTQRSIAHNQPFWLLWLTADEKIRLH